MDSFAAARQMMVDGQLRINDVTDPYLLGAVQAVPRERFVPPDKVQLAYLDYDLPLTEGADGRPPRYLMKPLVLGKLIEIADVERDSRVLDVGCATGYSTAVLASLAAHVVALEEDPKLVRAAVDNLAALGISNVTMREGALAAGAAADGPFDVILINGAVEVLPEPLQAQLADGGRLVCVLRRGPAGKGMIYRASGGHVSGRAVFDAVAPLLPGFVEPPEFVF